MLHKIFLSGNKNRLGCDRGTWCPRPAVWVWVPPGCVHRTRPRRASQLSSVTTLLPGAQPGHWVGHQTHRVRCSQAADVNTFAEDPAPAPAKRA